MSPCMADKLAYLEFLDPGVPDDLNLSRTLSCENESRNDCLNGPIRLIYSRSTIQIGVRTTASGIYSCLSGKLYLASVHLHVYPCMILLLSPHPAQCERCGFYGQQWARHQCLPVLHHIRQATSPGHEVYHHWKVRKGVAIIIQCLD